MGFLGLKKTSILITLLNYCNYIYMHKTRIKLSYLIELIKIFLNEHDITFMLISLLEIKKLI